MGRPVQSVILSSISNWGFCTAKFHYTLSSSVLHMCTMKARIPFIQNKSTILVKRDGVVVYSVTKYQNQYIVTFYDEITPDIALFITQSLMSENLVLFYYICLKTHPKGIHPNHKLVCARL